MMTALAAPAPAPPAERIARGQIESAVALVQVGRYGEAIESLSQALASNALTPADTARAHFDRGLAYDGLGNMRAALADYGAALRLDPLLAPALNNRADALRRAGRFEAAKRDYAAALKCPGVTREFAFYGLGLIAEQQGDGDGARGHFQRALAANPDFAPAAEKLAKLIPAKAEAGLLPLRKKGRAGFAAAEPVTAGPDANAVLVQLGACQTEAIAHAAWNKIAAASGDALLGRKPIAVPVDRAGKPRLWRLRTAVPDRRAAETLCSTLAQRQFDCVLVRS
jgi:tetratricopeptide (TPR) repeat protein